MEFGSFVGPVEGDRAYFQYEQVDLHASCGPMASLPCGEGIHITCNRCDTVSIELALHYWGPGHRGSFAPSDVRCDMPCPEVENPDLERVRRLIEHFPMGLTLSAAPSGCSA